MTVILPELGHSIDEIETKLNGRVLKTIQSALNDESPQEYNVNIALPKFKLEQKYELNTPLRELGATLAFDKQRADFTKIAPDVHISAVVHQAVVEVNEKGTEAAAATGIVMNALCMKIPMPIKEFICDRPFLFLIHEKNHGTVLFIGKYVKP